MDSVHEEDKDEHDIVVEDEEGEIEQNSSIIQRSIGLRRLFMSQGANNSPLSDKQQNNHNTMMQFQHSNSYYDGLGDVIGDEEVHFHGLSYQSIGIRDSDDVRYKKKWVFNQLQKMQFNDENIIFCLERIEDFETLSKQELLQLAANQIPDEMAILEMDNVFHLEFQDIVNKAKALYQFGRNQLVHYSNSSSSDQHNHQAYLNRSQQDIFPSNILQFNNKKNLQSEKRRANSVSSYLTFENMTKNEKKINQNSEFFKSSLIVSSNNTDLKFQCAICCEEYGVISCKCILPCNHMFCSECLKQYVLNKINCCQVLQILCPQEGCGQEYNEKQIQDIVEDEHQVERYIKFKQRQQLSQDPDIRWCIRPGCSNAIKGEKNNPKLECNVCGMHICYFCTNEWHQGLSCEEAIDQDYKKMAKNFKVKLCPSCKSKIQKNDGCNHMTCPRCSFEFCWLCTKPYRSGHYSQTNVLGCPGLMFSQRIPPCFRFLVILKMFLLYFGYFLLIVLALGLSPLFILLASMGTPTFLYFLVKKDYYVYSNLCTEILKVAALILIGVLTFPLNLFMAIFPGLIVMIVQCLRN